MRDARSLTLIKVKLMKAVSTAHNYRIFIFDYNAELAIAPQKQIKDSPSGTIYL